MCMNEGRSTKGQKDYLIAELKDLVNNYEVYELESPNDYATILSILTGMLNEDWHTHISETDVDEFLISYFEEELSKTN